MAIPTHIYPIKPVKPNLSSQIYQTIPTKKNLPNVTYKTKPTRPDQTYQTKPNLQNQNFQRNKIKVPKLNSWVKFAIPNVNQSQKSLSSPWTWHTTAQACPFLTLTPMGYRILWLPSRPPQSETMPARIFQFFMCLRLKVLFILVSCHF